MENCKNCMQILGESDAFCSGCGAQFVRERLTLKRLLSSVLLALGWDSKFFVTLRYLLYQPHIILKEYIGGTRKKYANPFTFFTIVTAISLFILTQYSEAFVEMIASGPTVDFESAPEADQPNAQQVSSQEIIGYKNQREFALAIGTYQLKYYNLISFLTLPLYALFSFLVFRKPYNYGEHLVINTYLISITTLFSLGLFLFSLGIDSNIFSTLSLVIMFAYYCYVFQRLYKLSFARFVLKVLKFLGIVLIFMFFLVFVGFIVGFILKG